MKFRRFGRWHSLVGGGLGVMLLSCYSASVDEHANAPIAPKSQEIIGGFSANDAALNAVGAIAVRYDWGYSDLICSAVLISESTALTAKHCTQALSSGAPEGAKFVFQFGPNTSSPIREVEIVDISEPPAAMGGFTGIGYDVAAVHLADAVSDVTPLPWAALDAAALGEKYVGIGYGVQNNNGSYGTRKLGDMTLRARSGKVFEVFFGSFEAFFEWFAGYPLPPECAASADDDAGVPVAGQGGSGGKGGSGSGGKGGAGGSRPPSGGSDAGGPFDSWQCQYVEYAHQVYDSTVLQNAEVIAGTLPGEAQACYGDSGGPLLRKRADGTLTVYGVVNGGIGSSQQQICDYGTVYTSFDQAVLDFIDRANKWVDPCDELSSIGQCSGSVAQRCSKIGEGKRRKLSFDCAAVNLPCQAQDDGSIGCGHDDTYFRPDAPPDDVVRAVFDPKAAEHAAFREPSSFRR